MWSINQQEQNTTSQCSFCKKSQDQVRLIAGVGGVTICDDCVDLYRSHIEKNAGKYNAMTKIIQVCSSCGTRSPVSHRYCFNCGFRYTMKESVPSDNNS